MNVPEMYRILFIEAVEKQSVDFTEGIFKACSQHNFDAKEILEVTLKNHLIEMIKSPNLAATQHYIQFTIELAKRNLIGTQMPALLISDTIDMLPVDKCKEYFISLLDDKTETWSDTFFITSRKILLRLCNKLLARLSTVDQAIFRGQILLFLAKILPLNERSGCNVDNQYNTDYFQVKSESSLDKMNDLTIDPSFENFKILQAYLRDPDKCFTKDHWNKFMISATCVLTFFLENDVKEAEDSQKLPICGKVEYTDEFLRISVYNCKFRREILVQMLMVYQYLNSQVLNKKQREAIQTNTATIYKILEESRPDGKKFLASVQKILEGEKRWSAWKSAGCPERPKPANTKLNLLIPPKKRLLGDILKETLTKNKDSAESPPINPLEDCMSPSRNFLPTNEGKLGWKPLGLIAKRSTHEASVNNETEIEEELKVNSPESLINEDDQSATK